ncbi:DUF4926 domain-containing protein [Actinokineospora diospyrosa]|uniref:DUF4926 domain-containing protein n=1 Tax=Actinokineospora diospyrosa TaxID=103728 RepID=A0ABT1IC71_9PSEU|nr:DUF4926 domain-containing protein [Actinokineospora diospyrosa]MCP2270227.1 protein of unknown function (DUF4926) [Actinokineospora diospyrosa]
MTFALFDLVRVKNGRPQEGLAAGACGTVVVVFEAPVPGYEIEVADENGRTLYQGSFAPEELEPW